MANKVNSKVKLHVKKGDTVKVLAGDEKIEAPIHLSHLMVVVGGTATRVGRKVNEAGKLQRFAKTTGEFIK